MFLIVVFVLASPSFIPMFFFTQSSPVQSGSSSSGSGSFDLHQRQTLFHTSSSLYCLKG